MNETESLNPYDRVRLIFIAESLRGLNLAAGLFLAFVVTITVRAVLFPPGSVNMSVASQLLIEILFLLWWSGSTVGIAANAVVIGRAMSWSSFAIYLFAVMPLINMVLVLVVNQFAYSHLRRHGVSCSFFGVSRDVLSSMVAAARGEQAPEASSAKAGRE